MGTTLAKTDGSTRGMKLSEEHKNNISKGLVGLFAGVKNPQAKITQEIADEMRVLYATTKISYRLLSEKYGITIPTIQEALYNITWKDSNYVFDAESAKAKLSNKGEDSPTAILSKKQVDEIRYLYTNDISISMRMLAKRFEISLASIQMIIRNRNWPDPNYTYIPRKKK
jgi:hypothetical protein